MQKKHLKNIASILDKNPQQSVKIEHLYLNNEAAEKEIKELSPFVIAPKTIRYLGINLIKEVKDLSSEN